MIYSLKTTTGTYLSSYWNIFDFMFIISYVLILLHRFNTDFQPLSNVIENQDKIETNQTVNLRLFSSFLLFTSFLKTISYIRNYYSFSNLFDLLSRSFESLKPFFALFFIMIGLISIILYENNITFDDSKYPQFPTLIIIII